MRRYFPEHSLAVPEGQHVVVGAISNWLQRFLIGLDQCLLLEFEFGVRIDVCGLHSFVTQGEGNDGPADAIPYKFHGSQWDKAQGVARFLRRNGHLVCPTAGCFAARQSDLC